MKNVSETGDEPTSTGSKSSFKTRVGLSLQGVQITCLQLDVKILLKSANCHIGQDCFK